MKEYALRIPDGVKDYIGKEAALKESIQNKIKKVFRTNSYNLVETPTFEYLDVFALGTESYQQPSLYHLVNREGELMALRSDMTRSIARLVSMQKLNRVLPQRLCYLKNSFRYPERYQGKLHEFTQAGIELIGSSSLKADAEVIRIAVKCLKEIGISDFVVHIGSSKILEYILEDLGFNEEECKKVFGAIEAKDAVELKNILRLVNIERDVLELLLELIECSGKIELLKSIKCKLPSLRAKKTLEDMENLYSLLEDYGINECIKFDFSLMSYGKYYTGIMFQIFTFGVGTSVVQGGRYDNLLGLFGEKLPAVGFGININLILERLINQKDLEKFDIEKTLAVCTPATRKVCQEISDNLRNNDMIIENCFFEDIKNAINYSKTVGISKILYFKNEYEVDFYNLKENTIKKMNINQLLGGKYESNNICAC